MFQFGIGGSATDRELVGVGGGYERWHHNCPEGFALTGARFGAEVIVNLPSVAGGYDCKYCVTLGSHVVAGSHSGDDEWLCEQRDW